jgi:hypothetical protein
VTGVAFGDDVFVAVGWSRSGGATTARVWTSADGLDWTAQPDDAFEGISFGAVAYSGTNFYAFASAPTTVWKSADGRSWQQIELPVAGGELGGGNVFEGGTIEDAASVGGRVYAAGGATLVGGDIACNCVAVWRSHSDSEWDQAEVSDDDTFNAFAVVPDMILVINHGNYIGQSLRSSPDYDTWTAPDAALAEGSGYLDAAASDDRIVAVGYWGPDYDIPISLVWNGSIWLGTSFDEHVGAPAEQVAFAGGRFVAIGSQKSTRLVAISWSSADGLTWTRGPDVYDREREDLGPEPGDDPFTHRTIGAGAPGFVLAQTFSDGLHVWSAPAEVYAPGL